MRIIGLTGAAGAGKDTAAKMAIEWCEKQGLDARRLAFADPLKVSAARALGFQGASALGSPEETAECVAFCNDVKQDGVQINVSLYIPPDCGPEPVPPEWQPITELSGRQFLQFYGTEAHRDVFGTDFWVEVTEKKLAELRDGTVTEYPPDVVFITDCRFPNEAEAIRGRGGEVWSIQRPGLQAVEAHASEAGLPAEVLDRLIVNVGTLVDLRELVNLTCEQTL